MTSPGRGHGILGLERAGDGAQQTDAHVRAAYASSVDDTAGPTPVELEPLDEELEGTSCARRRSSQVVHN